ncbi:unnamed protein product [Cyberlindnera jadinii]|uniref:K Homology domain-containing protein n=1 Tax=Cyberlindnera jadinii (strain ATCC 18201 / CBS 1600 / BCRC 20928 / JCM 3617 / NBRC 0987 / NRRL Y-1542) TaxID=983966 RepID=A0A0H5C3D1_CYBJN|nr:hypothetical protein CYBJADRAFT_160667 [Cyberlindnera jadinii NRRL Y-1542]ODV75219.1 hypothetical protein CYBJADRAFT_160667 [Cyberlindnera jadinii NRRL Y-1542]CEP22378.1 unnamed protein product [Cyberlindnera jadinii]
MSTENETNIATAVADVEINDENNSTTDVVSEESTAVETPVETTPVPPPSINDENAFPTLGSGVVATNKNAVSWGPSMKTTVSSGSVSSAPSSNGNSSNNLTAGVARSKNVQEAFNISHIAALNIIKTEFIKIVSDLKKAHNVSIESTLSTKTQDRSFIVTGKPNDVARVRRELVRRLTKPVAESFKVPASTRSAIIGSGGRNLKPIVEATATKIDIERSQTPSSTDQEDDDEITVTITGDVDGVLEAKKSILAIVEEETKTLTARITVPERVRPFVQPLESSEEDLVVAGPNKNGIITISGLRDEVISKKNELSQEFDSLNKKIKVDVKTIPKKYQQFINTEQLWKEFQVVVKLPDGEDDTEVEFVGLEKNVDAAIKSARNTSSQFVIDSLVISRAHGGDVVHARRLAAFLSYSGLLKEIGKQHHTSIQAPPYSKLAGDELSSIAIETSGPSSDPASIQASRKAIIDTVNRFTPSRFLVVSDLSSFFAKRVVHATEGTAKVENVAVVPLSELSNNATDDIIFVALDGKDDEFAPTQEEIDSRLRNTAESLDELRKAQEHLKRVVLDVPSDKQQFIAGPNGTTLASLIESANSVNIVLHNDGKAEADDKVFIEGAKTDVVKVEKEIATLLADAADQTDLYSFVLETTVPTSVLSRLIGKSGSNLKEISEKFAVNIDVDKEDSGEKTGLKITGYKFNVKEAEVHIAHAAKRWADEITKTLIVAKQYRASLIGSNGQNVKKLQTKYNVAIHFDRTTDDVTIKGPSRGVAKATEELKDLLDFEIANGYTKELTVPVAAISRIIGRSGENVNRIAVDTGVDVRVHKGPDGSETGTIVLTGSRTGLTNAEKQIEAIVKEVEDTITVELEVDQKYFKDILGPKGATKQKIITQALGNSEGVAAKLLHVPEAGSDVSVISSTGPKKVVENIIEQIKAIVADKESAIQETLEIPKNKHRLLIGAGGFVRRSLEDEFDVYLDIPKAESKSDSVVIQGQPANVEKAKAKVLELTADSWKTVVEVPVNVHASVFQRGLFAKDVRIEHNVDISFGDANRKAQKLSNAVPTLPDGVRGEGEETEKFTVVEDKPVENDDVIPWRLSGEDEEVAKVEKLIKDAIAQHSNDDTIGFFWFKTPEKVFRKVIGSQGSRLNSLRKKSGAQITVPKPSDKVNDIIYIKGPKAAVEKAEKLLRSEISA